MAPDLQNTILREGRQVGKKHAAMKTRIVFVNRFSIENQRFDTSQLLQES